MEPTRITPAMVEAKERELKARRDALLQRERAAQSVIGEPDPNFPPSFLCIRPLIHHDIAGDIPVEFRRFMYTLCTLYLSLIVLIIYNIVVASIVFIFRGNAMHFGLSFLYLVGIPGAFIVWYYNSYEAVRTESTPRHLLAYLGLLFGLGFDAWMAVGVPSFGGCGWIITITSVGNSVTFIMCLVAAVLWTVHGVVMFSMMVAMWGKVRSMRVIPSNIYRVNEL